MPEIGATLREARMRLRIDVAEVETATKIRAKYLRALENEEWDLLPGPTFVKTFLRTYGDYLGIDSKILVEEYKQRFERPSAAELMPFGGALGGRRQRRAPIVPPFAVVGLVTLLLLGLLFFLGRGSDEPATPNRPVTESPSPEPDEPTRNRRDRRSSPAVARLRILPTGIVNVCLVDARGRILVRSQTLAPGANTRTFRSRRFRVTFGNGAARYSVNGKRFDVPDRQDAVGLEITARSRRTLAEGRRPTCAG